MFLNKYFPTNYWNVPYFPIGGDSSSIFTIDGISRINQIQVNSILITDNLNGRNTLSFVIVMDDSFLPVVGHEVVIEAAPCAGAKFIRIFGGQINRISKTSKFKNAPKFYSIECTDFNQIADKRLARKLYPRQPVKDVILNLVSQFLSDEGITANNVFNSGLILERAIFSYKKVSDAFNDISRITGLHWYIDYYKDLHFFLRSTTPADLEINETNNPPLSEFCDWLDDRRNKACPGIKWANLKVTEHREQLSNQHWVIAGNDTTEQRTDAFDGDGDRQAFNLKYALADISRDEVTGDISVDAVKVGGLNESIGVRDIDTGFKWYFTKGEHEIVQDDAETPVSSGTKIEVTYTGLRPIIVQEQNTESITERKTIEKNSGLYQSVEDDEAIESREFARQRARGHVRRFGPVPKIVDFTTDQAILFAGQLIRIELPEFELEGSFGQGDPFLIDSVSINGIASCDDQGKPRIVWRQTPTCLSGEHLGGWQEWFRTLERFGRQLKLREQTVLLLSETGLEELNIEQTFTLDQPLGLHVHPCEECWPIGFAVIGKSPHCRAEFNVLNLE